MNKMGKAHFGNLDIGNINLTDSEKGPNSFEYGGWY